MKNRKWIWGLLIALSPGTMLADDTMFETDNRVEISVSNIAALTAADDAESFTVLLKEGEPVYGVVVLNNIGGSSVSGILVEPERPSIMVANKTLSISHCAQRDLISVSTPGGAVLLRMISEGSGAKIDLSDFEAGLYLVSVGNASFKFIKR